MNTQLEMNIMSGLTKCKGTWKETISGGNGIVNYMLGEIKSYCFLNDISCEIQCLRKGWLTSKYGFNLEGDGKKILQLQQWVRSREGYSE